MLRIALIFSLLSFSALISGDYSPVQAQADLRDYCRKQGGGYNAPAAQAECMRRIQGHAYNGPERYRHNGYSYGPEYVQPMPYPPYIMACLDAGHCYVDDYGNVRRGPSPREIRRERRASAFADFAAGIIGGQEGALVGEIIYQFAR